MAPFSIEGASSNSGAVQIAQSRSLERMMKESMYAASKLRSRLSARDEDVSFSVASESIERPAYLRRKPSQGKGDV